jgi:hypothetical protein
VRDDRPRLVPLAFTRTRYEPTTCESSDRQAYGAERLQPDQDRGPSKLDSPLINR